MGDDFVEVYRGGGGQFRAEMLRSLLSGSGIESIVSGGAIAGYPTTVGTSGEFAIVVREADAERARELLHSFDAEGTGVEEMEWRVEDDEDSE